MINGEIVPIFRSNRIFVQRRTSYQTGGYGGKRPSRLAPADRRVVSQMLGIAIQEVCYTSERELLRYKGYADYKKGKRKKETV